MEEKNESSSVAIDPVSRVAPILEHLSPEDTEIDKGKIQDLFVKLWEFEEGDKLTPDEQHLTTIGLFIFATHNILDDYNIRKDKARQAIIEALRRWRAPLIEAEVEHEKSSGNPFQTFVATQQPKIDEIYTWRHFMLDHKQADGKEWTYKMKSCWFATFFIHLGRTDYIETACGFDKLPWEARQDYVDLKLNNLFMKLGNSCQFRYTPKK
ncbi:MAG: hypothetical protein COV67_05155 [Nitrospinae bacterium CG11_big_fil_rev_8_21_14_0_20_56_8]|nr:MAG: hypothetical protein COV67_05155 [Nitrospinae bacterium CG11_big_fil_rev_8_21_14_0_20_56_8]